jgi:hypothetical protein
MDRFHEYTEEWKIMGGDAFGFISAETNNCGALSKIFIDLHGKYIHNLSIPEHIEIIRIFFIKISLFYPNATLTILHPLDTETSDDEHIRVYDRFVIDFGDELIFEELIIGEGNTASVTSNYVDNQCSTNVIISGERTFV